VVFSTPLPHDKKPEDWLAPSIQHKLDSHIKLIDNVKKLLTITRIDIEVAAFDIQKCNRKLFKGDRSHIRNMAPRFIHGFQRYDKVLWNKLDGNKVHASAKAKELTLLETANNSLIEPLERGTLFHTLKSVVSATPAPHGDL
jgi:hypothetical protein